MTENRSERSRSYRHTHNITLSVRLFFSLSFFLSYSWLQLHPSHASAEACLYVSSLPLLNSGNKMPYLCHYRRAEAYRVGRPNPAATVLVLFHSKPHTAECCHLANVMALPQSRSLAILSHAQTAIFSRLCATWYGPRIGHS